MCDSHNKLNTNSHEITRGQRAGRLISVLVIKYCEKLIWNIWFQCLANLM